VSTLRVATLAVFVASCIAYPVAAQQQQQQTVLAIHWGPEEFPATPIVNATLRESLTADPELQIEYFSEYLESDLFPSAQASEALADYIFLKYRGRRIDLVIAVADRALEFVREHRDELFPGAPVVYAGLGDPAVFGSDVRDGVTGVLRGAAYAETLALALQLHPSTERAFVIARSASADSQAGMREVLRPFQSRVQLAFLDDETVEGLLASVRAIPPRSVVLFIGYPHVIAGRVTGGADLVPLVTAASPAPVYGTNEDYIGRGAVGGIVPGRVASAERLGWMARQILNGRRPDDIPAENARLMPIFDWRQLQARGIDSSRLPPDAEVRFQTVSAWEALRGYVITSVVVFVVQLALIGTLLRQWVRRRHAERLIRSREATLRVSFDRIRRLTGRLIHAQESTRAAIARDLHDDVCQELVAVTIGVTSLKASSAGLPAAVMHGELSQLQERTLDIVDRVRRLSHDLHPVTLRLLGLPAALRAHCIEVEKRYDVQVALHVAGDVGTLPADAALGLFRIAQEALRNGAVHGEARRLDVALSRLDDEIELIVTDDGRGFDPEAARREGSGLGLVSIEERAHLARGTVSITSRLWHGTTVRVCVPAHEEGAAGDAAPSSLMPVHSEAVKS
jgi:signal transduction histidine kinase